MPKSKALAIISMILGVSSVVLMILCFMMPANSFAWVSSIVLSIIASPMAFMTGIEFMRNQTDLAKYNPFAIIGISLGSLILILWMVFLVLVAQLPSSL